MKSEELSLDSIAQHIVMVRGQKILLDADLAALYGVDTRRLNEQVRRNHARFPVDFMFELTPHEIENLRSHFATSSWGGRRSKPLAFTEHGAIMAATVLKSPRAIEMSVYVVRAFVQMRNVLANNHELAMKLAELELKTVNLSAKHQSLAQQLAQVTAAIRQLMAEPPSTKRPIGFIISEQKEK
jgi:hypothetical protein